MKGKCLGRTHTYTVRGRKAGEEVGVKGGMDGRYYKPARREVQIRRER